MYPSHTAPFSPVERAGNRRIDTSRCYDGKPAVAVYAGPDPHRSDHLPNPVCEGHARAFEADAANGHWNAWEIEYLLCETTVHRAGEPPGPCGLELPCPRHPAAGRG